jgi:hypothetical protein
MSSETDPSLLVPPLSRFRISLPRSAEGRCPSNNAPRSGDLLRSTSEIDIFGFHALIGVRLCLTGQFDQICSHSVSNLRAF